MISEEPDCSQATKSSPVIPDLKRELITEDISDDKEPIPCTQTVNSLPPDIMKEVISEYPECSQAANSTPVHPADLLNDLLN